MVRPIPTPPGLAAEYEEGKSLKALSLQHGFSRSTVTRMLLEEGVTIRSTSDTQRIPTPPGLVAEYEEEKTLEALGRQHGFSLCTAKRMLRDEGVTIRNLRATSNECATPGCTNSRYKTGKCSRRFCIHCKDIKLYWGHVWDPKPLCPICEEKTYQPRTGRGKCLDCARKQTREPKTRWDRDTCLKALEMCLRQTGGNPPTIREWKAHKGIRPSHYTIFRLFGSWSNFLELLCAEPREPKTRWDRDTCLKALEMWLQQTGGIPPTMSEWGAHKGIRPSRSTIARLFGSWSYFLELLGAEPRAPVPPYSPS